jgi:hypothetical protein
MAVRVQLSEKIRAGGTSFGLPPYQGDRSSPGISFASPAAENRFS